ncbi:MAG: hypothetical protein ABFD77_01220 [Thermotogota bacterium]
MARVINRWDPARNVDMIVAAADGPLVLEADDPRWPLIAREWVQPIVYAYGGPVGYLRTLSVVDGVDPQNGLDVHGLQYMPDNMTFFGADPVDGEPQPDDRTDLIAGTRYRYVTTGHRLALRGWIGSFNPDNLNVEFEVWWGDKVQRDPGEARGSWTGAVLSVLNAVNFTADYLAYALHGKRRGDASWELRGGLVERPTSLYIPSTSAVSPWDGVDSGRFRILITGGTPSWTVSAQYWDPGIPGWVDIASSVVDLRSYAVPGYEEFFFLNGYLFHGATKVYPGAMPANPPTQETFFRRVSVSQFQPWILDVGDTYLREGVFRLSEMFGPLPYWLLPADAKTPSIDIMHYPNGPAAPSALRIHDDDGGWGIGVQQDTLLAMMGIEDRKLLTVTGYPGRHLPVCLADQYAIGPTLPFAYVGRYKLANLDTWTDERCLVSFGRAGYQAAPSSSISGLGLNWRPTNGGELVLRHWDGVAPGWLELVAPLRIDEYNNRLVDLGFCWTGDYGSLAGLQNRQLRIVVDGVTKATVAFSSLIRIASTVGSTIGTGDPLTRKSFEGIWFGGATFYEPATDADLLHAFDAEGEGGFANPSFEIEADSGRPGEAKDWEWQTQQNVGGFAEFSAYRADLAPYHGDVEGFEGGWLRAPSWVYADETARLAATGFTAADVGKAAHQLDINRNYILTSHSPITWQASSAGENQDWEDDLVDAEAAVFNAAIPNYKTTVEHFIIWGQTWDMMVWSGTPWLPAYNLTPPCQDTLGPFGGPTGFDGWYDHLYGTNLDPLSVESFDEAWGNDPLSTAGGQRWQPDPAPGGRLRGQAISFPLFIPANENRLVILTDIGIPAMFSLPSSNYADMATLLTDLNALLTVHLPGLGLTFDSWLDGTSEGLTFGWDGSTLTALWFGFGTLESEMTKDSRGRLGLRSFSPGGAYTGVGIPAWFYPSLPAGAGPTDRFLLDSWSCNSILTFTDLVLGLVVLENDLVGAMFDTAISYPTLLERFLLTSWVSPLAVWVTDLSAVVLVQAMFDSGAHTREDFLDTEWPDEIFPT